MTYTFTDEFTVNDLGLVAEIDYTVTPYVRIRRVLIKGENGLRYRCPSWLVAAFRPSDDALIEHAKGRDQATRNENAEYWCDRLMDAAE